MNPTTPNMAAIEKVIRQIPPLDTARVYLRRYSMVICAAGHHLTGEGDPPTECPICKERGS